MTFDPHFAADGTADLPILAFGKAAFKKWLEAQTAARRGWVNIAGFTAEPGSVLLLPDDKGVLEGALFGWDKDDFWSFAHLPAKLPAGAWRIDAALPPAQANVAALAWGLAHYQFGRYKSTQPDDAAKPRLTWPAATDRDLVLRLVSAIGLARDLVNTPANDLGPAELSNVAAGLAQKHGADFRVVVGDALLDERFRDHPLIREAPGLRFFAGAPIRSPAGVHVAALCVFDEQPRPADNDYLREGMQDLAQTVESELLLRSFKLRDPVTGLYNQQTFQFLAERAWRRARNARLNASIVTVSLDRPPQQRQGLVPDSEALVRQASQRIQACCADTRHILARDRTDRFALLVLNERQDAVRLLAESIGLALGEAVPPAAPAAISIGVAHARPLPAGDKSLIDLLERAQSARLRSREGGSGCVYVA